MKSGLEYVFPTHLHTHTHTYMCMHTHRTFRIMVWQCVRGLGFTIFCSLLGNRA